MLIHQDDGSWQPNRHEDAAWYWSLVEDDALERNYAWYQEKVIPDHPTIHAVVFIESKDGKRRPDLLRRLSRRLLRLHSLAPETGDLDPAAGADLIASGVQNEAAERAEG